MSSLPSNPDQSDDHKTKCASVMLFGKRQVRHFAVYASLGIIMGALFVLVSFFGVSYHTVQESSGFSERSMQEPVVTSEKGRQTAGLIKKLKDYGLWELTDPEEVPRFFIKAYPADLNTVQDISVKKKVFFHSLLPHALFVRQEALSKRSKLESLLSKIDCAVETLDFGSGQEYGSQCSWTDYLSEKDENFIQKLCTDYRTTSAEGLLERVDAVPVSIILAQGALESSWGSSRFTREGNSVFGMWTWKTPGIVPSQREDGKNHKVKIYKNILESVKAYHLTLNRLDSYEEFRQLRRQTDNPLILAEGLTLYSERGKDYVEDIKNVILSNDLQRYDACNLGDYDLREFTGPVSEANNLAESSNASL